MSPTKTKRQKKKPQAGREGGLKKAAHMVKITLLQEMKEKIDAGKETKVTLEGRGQEELSTKGGGLVQGACKATRGGDRREM